MPTDNVPYTENERCIGQLLVPGKANAISIRELKKLTGMDERSIKGAVEALRKRHNVPVGASRKPPYGYFILDTGEEIEESFNTLMSQARSMIESALTLPGIKQQRIREYLGQLAMEFGL